MVKADCPACDAKVHLGVKPKMGQRVVCPSCDTEIEVVWLEPVELDWPYDEGYMTNPMMETSTTTSISPHL